MVPVYLFETLGCEILSIVQVNNLLLGVKPSHFVAPRHFSKELDVRKRNHILEVHGRVSRKFDSRMLQLFLIVVSSQSTAQRCIVYSCNAKPVFVYAICQPLNMLRYLLNDTVLRGAQTLNGTMYFLLHTWCVGPTQERHLWFLNSGIC